MKDAQIVWNSLTIWCHCARNEDGTYFAHIPEVWGVYGEGKSVHKATEDLSAKVLKLLKEAN